MKRSSLLLVIGVCFLTACDHQEKRQSLEKYIIDVKQRNVAQIEPLPEVRPYETFTYKVSDLRSPFVTPEPEQVVFELPDDNGIRPDVNRRKEPLESFPLDSLRMVGTIEKDFGMWAIVVDTEGTVHRITKGNFIGQNHGKIEVIDEEKMIIREIVADPKGGWKEKEASMALIEEAQTQ